MNTIRASVEAQSKALSDAAAEILAQPKVAERRYVPITSAGAVLRYASDFIPSWAGAISIDLLPAVLVAMMMVVHAAMRRGEDEMEDATDHAGDMMRSLRCARCCAPAATKRPLPRASRRRKRQGPRLTRRGRPGLPAPRT